MILIELPVNNIDDLFADDPVVRGQRIAEITTEHPKSSYGIPVILLDKEVYDVPAESVIRPLPKGFGSDSSSKEEVALIKEFVIAARRAGRSISFMPALTKKDLKDLYAWQILEKKIQKKLSGRK